MSPVYDDIDPSYAATCSDVTLYSDPKGFMKTLVEEMVALTSTGDWLKEKFEKAAGDSGKLTAVFEHQKLIDALTEIFSRIQPIYRSKDGKVSIQRRLEAQKALDEEDLIKALGLVSQAVLKAPMTGEIELLDGGVSLALALWLRSEILLKSNRPKAALEDLKLALKERLPAKMRGNYYWRMGHCYKGTGEPTRAKVSYELAARLLVKDDEAKEQLERDITLLKEKKIQEAEPLNNNTGISLTAGAKLNIPALSKLVKITEDGNKGRFAVANSPIKTGDVLLIENPYAACLLPEYYGTHCLHCFKRLEDCIDEAPVWCTNCTGVAFCSIQCQNSALSTYHKYECQFLDLFIGSGISILSFIALRMVTQAGLDTSLLIYSKHISNEVQTVEGSALNDIEGSAKKSKIKSRKERLNRTKKALKTFDKNSKDDSDVENKPEEKITFKEVLELKAAQIYSLCTHSELRKSEDYLKRIIVALFLTECLKQSGFFGNCDQDILNKHKKEIALLILRNLQLLQFNAHEVYETLKAKNQKGSRAIYIAVGIYPTGALFNHECYPAVARYFEGSKIILRATRPLYSGEVVSENYGPNFLSRQLKERQRALSCRYWFRCTCSACEEDWPSLKQMNDDIPLRLKCTNKDCCNKIRVDSQKTFTCNKCDIENNELMRVHETIKKCIEEYQSSMKISTVSPQEAITGLCPAIDRFHEFAFPPHRDTHLAQETLRNCFASLGNVHILQTQNC